MAVEPIKIAILAMGGEGGGVLADWIVSLAEADGYFAQTTSVPGVAQRTGATIYYLELFPGATQPDARVPVLALTPLPGDVDIVLASELMEAGRAVQRGFVTRERTTLLASSHRVYSIAEKSALGDGRVDEAALAHQAREAARRFVSFDMAQLAQHTGSVISAVLFGALSAADVLPFRREQFEATIERGGLGVAASLKAFDAGYQATRAEQSGAWPALQDHESIHETYVTHATHASTSAAQPPRDAGVAALVARALDLPVVARDLALEGVRRLIDYQDVAYASLYLDRLDVLRAAPGGGDAGLLGETARHLALWMSYEDTIRVADLKTRASRFERVRGEVHANAAQVLQINEFMHPRIEEICETLPAGLGRWLARPHRVHRIVARFAAKGRVIQTSSLGGFLLLYLLAGWRRGRRTTLRYALETRRIDAWLRRIEAAAAIDAALALEIAQCQRLVKGYGDTHARGLRNYETLMTVVDRHAEALSPRTLRELREKALADENGHQLREHLQRCGFSVDAGLGVA
ncbi:indolepyruvate oxidoreductase subunit beta family protein [Paraburkholderia antibiotica]|uniref:Indolepyruvate oxidoreductase subunit beta family protein n=1 Tax=Paraburkholderia antibiotica TaxID=2728839 RepID=A0A7Y0A172_9BURK|nr:indolepyruvate oxidoreductase subunit beta family protein [Paraburkholderia antibiotica]NML34588.1 indolepyruvate oxidoreductase subunit beta family protein [Paraburkholderia antibiotica]